MTIRSVDMQVLVQKVGEVTKLQQTEKTDQQVRQQAFLEQIAQQTEQTSKTVNQTPASEAALIREKQEEKKKNLPLKKTLARVSLMKKKALIGQVIQIEDPT